MYQTGYYATGYHETGYYMRGAEQVVVTPPTIPPPPTTVSAPGGGGGGFEPFPRWAPTQEPYPDEFYEGEEEIIIALCAIFVEIMDEWDH